MVFSAGGQLIASGSYDRTMKLWSVSPPSRFRTVISRINPFYRDPQMLQTIDVDCPEDIPRVICFAEADSTVN